MSEDLKNIFKEKYDAYVICSTLNQIVNYIPLKMLQDKGVKIGKIINIKVESSGNRKQFNSDNWDENLKSILEEDIQYCIKLPRKFDLDIYEDRIQRQIENKKINANTILWNITGGQRSTVVAIQEVVRKRYEAEKEDVIIYLEGNTNDVIVGKRGSGNEIRYIKYDGKYGIGGLTIEKAMKLAGFDLYGTGNTGINYLDKEYVIDKETDKLLDMFYDNYVKSQRFRIDMIATNKKNKENYEIEVGDKAWEKIIKEYKFMENLKEKIFKKKGKEEENKNQYKFGYLLEFITIKKIKEIINKKIKKDDKLKDYFIDLKHSLKIKNNYDGVNKKNQFCEFDIALLTRAGQLIFFECKSGGMTGEVAKARHYTSYAVGGVYETPIVITPLLSGEINNGKHDNFYDDIYSAIRAAKKSNIDVWGIDELETKLEELFEDVTGKEMK
ncbi:hypothetical protein [Paramaledivibacter caminithermalis]|jgi:hypothetical protein|uniref:Uncharacterized protein n=1 Tax=Paramaledivibacter caminithermalis (strain DSM 15212 / CIP 107654 / DViRD3) TaxID=1121301 RepID=A0A1M6QTT3_PARC5|nr:hypothetical protein [Paramaledivibacter caminithermalis]SHK23437.1 hypothetical protein SAMN02745912_02720 [Paramaledivibacter caminithermalis DSM 15212]